MFLYLIVFYVLIYFVCQNNTALLNTKKKLLEYNGILNFNVKFKIFTV